MSTKEIQKILTEHKLWLAGEGGKMADFSYSNLRGADLRGADLRKANLREADLCEADLRKANLRGADLCEANLRGADLCEANLRGANLREANLEFCKGIMSFTGEKHLLVYFKFNCVYYFKIGCITKTCYKWLGEFEAIGREHDYGENTKLYGDVIKLFSQYDLEEK